MRYMGIWNVFVGENLESVGLGCDLTVGRAEALLTGSPKSLPLVSAPFSPPPIHFLLATRSGEKHIT